MSLTAQWPPIEDLQPPQMPEAALATPRAQISSKLQTPAKRLKPCDGDALRPSCRLPASRAIQPQATAVRGSSLIRYWFDSSKARKTVRQGRFWGLLFAPEKRAKHAYQGRVRLTLCARCPSFVRLQGMGAARKPCFTRRLQGEGAQHFARRAFHHGGQPKRGSRQPQANAFRYHFDSSKARQTVR